MKYNLEEIPYISELYSYQNDEINQRVLCSADGQIKIINCSPKLLEEVLLYVDGINSFGMIEDNFKSRYSKEEVRLFLKTILNEGIVSLKDNNSLNKTPKILIIGEGVIADSFKDYESTTLNNFLNKPFENFDAAILAPATATYSEVLDVNQKLDQMKKPFIQITYNGKKLSVGPMVLPQKTACFGCTVSYELKRLNSKISDEEKIELSDLNDLKYCLPLPNTCKKSKIKFIKDILIEDITNLFNGNSSEFLNFQYKFDLEFTNYKKEEQLPATSCNLCNGTTKSYIKFEPNSMELDKVLKEANVNITNLNKNDIKYKVGGLRSKTETETFELLNEELDKFGTKVKIEPAYGNPFNDNDVIHCFNSSVEQTGTKEELYLFRKDDGAGKGLTESQAYFSAAFELLEHMSLQYSGDVPIICAKYKDVKEKAIDLPYLANTIMNTNTSFDDFDENNEIDWVVATSLTNGENKLVPAFLVFLYDVNLKGTLFGSSTNGIGSGTTLEDAILHGLFEAIERDAWLIGQSNPYVLPTVDYNSSNNSKLKNIISKIENLGYEIITRDYTNDTKIPVFRTWIVNKNDFSQYAYNGLGCHISPEIALERSITEAVQVDDWASTGGELDSDSITLSVLSNSLINLYNQHFLVNKDILGKTKKTTKITKPIFEMNSSYEILKSVAKQVKETVGGDVYYVELTRPESNIKVARTIITGDIQNLNVPLISASKRMFEFGIRCGYDNKKTIYEELYLGKYAH